MYLDFTEWGIILLFLPLQASDSHTPGRATGRATDRATGRATVRATGRATGKETGRKNGRETGRATGRATHLSEQCLMPCFTLTSWILQCTIITSLWLAPINMHVCDVTCCLIVWGEVIVDVVECSITQTLQPCD